MWDDFLLRAGLAGLGVVLAAAPLGCFTVWRRMAYFGDATSHGAILGVALALVAGLPVTPVVILTALALSLVMLRLVSRGQSADTALGVLSHGALAVGLVAVSFLPSLRVDLESLLFGDILSVRPADLLVIWGGALVVVATLAWRWQRLLTATLDADMARAAGIDPVRESLWLTLGLALTVALALKVVGALLIAAMLVLPPAAARPLANTPERMVLWTAVLGALAVLGGLAASLHLDTPAGPSIVSCAALIFVVTRTVARQP
ncbi:metal ABC transporter permease [Maribius pontilimi]|uniref:High-affinity zinc uptake system membrane protein ZnuB n=1 Tax=Palleronia pontilimi TaxID=1964209 RepID=A0A934ID76_9RHOB|nr:metal ABC transporter permease [Palleronia pontilimi]